MKPRSPHARAFAPCAALSLVAFAMLSQPFEATAARLGTADLADATSVIHLDGLWLFRAGDNLAFARTELDDLDWEQRQVPTAGTSWRFRWGGHGWYRLHLEVSERAAGYDTMIALGPAREVVEVYVNGALIAQRGEFSSRPRGGERGVPLLGMIPAGLLKPGDNVIAVRVYDPTWAGGLATGPLLLGPPTLVRERTEIERVARPAVHLALAAVAVVLALAHLIASRGRWGSREAWWLAGAGAALAVAHLGGTELLTAASPVLELAVRIPMFAAVFAALCIGSFFAARYDDDDAMHVRAGRIVYLVLAAALLLAPAAVVFWAAGPVLLLAALAASLYGTYLLARAAKRQEPHTVSLFATLVAFALVLVYDGLASTSADALAPLSVASAVGVLLVASVAGVQQSLAEHDRAIVRAQVLEQQLDADERVGILAVTAMSITDSGRFLEATVREAARELAVRRCSLVLAHADRLVIAASVGLPLHAISRDVPIGGSIVGWVFANRQPITDRSMPEELGRLTRAGQYATRAFISHPVQDGERCLGVLNVSDRIDGGDFSAADLEKVRDVAAKLALVLTRVGGI